MPLPRRRSSALLEFTLHLNSRPRVSSPFVSPLPYLAPFASLNHPPDLPPLPGLRGPAGSRKAPLDAVQVEFDECWSFTSTRVRDGEMATGTAKIEPPAQTCAELEMRSTL
eukprot:4278989-Pleurochrysis_carterae.AAC.1